MVDIRKSNGTLSISCSNDDLCKSVIATGAIKIPGIHDEYRVFM